MYNFSLLYFHFRQFCIFGFLLCKCAPAFYINTRPKNSLITFTMNAKKVLIFSGQTLRCNIWRIKDNAANRKSNESCLHVCTHNDRLPSDNSAGYTYIHIYLKTYIRNQQKCMYILWFKDLSTRRIRVYFIDTCKRICVEQTVTYYSMTRNVVCTYYMPLQLSTNYYFRQNTYM